MKFLLFFTFIIVITLYNRKYLGNLTPIIVFTSLLLYLISRYIDFTEVLQKLSNNKKEGFDGNIEQYKNNIIYSNFEKFTFNNTNKVLSDSSDLKLTDKLTVMVWVKQNEKSTDWVRVIGKGDATHRNYGIWIQNNNRLLAQIYPLSEGRNVWPLREAIESNTWTHLAMTFHKDNQHKLYKNGQLIKEEDTSGTPLTDDEPLTIGGAEFHAKFNGEITGAVVLNTVLDEDDIKKFAESPDKDLDDIFVENTKPVPVSAPSPGIAPPSENYSAPSPGIAPATEGDPMRLIEEGDKMSQIDNYENAIDKYNKALIQLTDSTDTPNQDLINELYSKISTEYRNLAATFNCDKEKEPYSK